MWPASWASHWLLTFCNRRLNDWTAQVLLTNARGQLRCASYDSHARAGSGMVLCDEIIQWLSSCGSFINSIEPGNGEDSLGFAIPAQPLHPAISDPPKASSASSEGTPSRSDFHHVLRTTTLHQARTHEGAEWKLLEQLSHELGKNLGDDGGRSSPLSPSDLAGLKRVAAFA